MFVLGFWQPENHVTVAWVLPLVSLTLTCLYCTKAPSDPVLTSSCLIHPCPQHGEVLPLKIVTYAAVSLSLAALLVAFVLLTLVRTLRSNLHGIHKNLIGALFFSQLVFVIGIAQTGNPVRPSAASPGGGGARRPQTCLQGGQSALYLKCNLGRSGWK